MIIFNKRKIIFILFFIWLFFIIFSMKKSSKEILEVFAVPISNHTVVIDAGHGNPDGGAESSDGTTEQEINLSIALKLQELLEQSGTVVILTRSDENGIYDLDENSIKNKKISDLKNRVEIANTLEAEIFVSIHLNKIREEQYSGFQTFYQANNENSKKLANYIQENLNFAMQKENKRSILELSGKYIMENSKIPTVTVECGFLSNRKETKLLKEEDYQMKLAWGIYLGIMDYFYE